MKVRSTSLVALIFSKRTLMRRENTANDASTPYTGMGSKEKGVKTNNSSRMKLPMKSRSPFALPRSETNKIDSKRQTTIRANCVHPFVISPPLEVGRYTPKSSNMQTQNGRFLAANISVK